MDKRRHLTKGEVERLIAATKGFRNEARDRCLLLLMFRHGLRVSEACGMKLSQVNIEERQLYVARLKGGLSTTHPLRAEEVKALKAWLAIRKQLNPTTDALFMSKRSHKITRARVAVLIKKYGERAGLALSPYPHMLRHACGFALADQGMDTRLIQDYLGHKNIQNTVIYTAANSARFERVWR